MMIPPPASPSPELPSCLTRQRGFALVLTMLFVGIIGVAVALFYTDIARQDRNRVFYSLGEQYAQLARVMHVYVQEHAYFSPYVNSADPRDVARLNYYQNLENTVIETFREPLGLQANPSLNVVTIENLRQTITDFGFLDSSIALDHPVRGVTYTFRGHGGLLPMGQTPDMQAASSLIVMYGRAAGSQPDIRTSSDMAAFRKGASAGGMERVGIVLPPSQRANLMCRGQQAIVKWGNNDNDCLSEAEASAIGMSLDTFDVVAPAWESVEKQLSKSHLYRRPHPGISGSNVMYVNLDMSATLQGSGRGIKDAVEIYTESVNASPSSTTETALLVGTIDPATQLPDTTVDSDAILMVGYPQTAGSNREPSICNNTDVRTCISGDMEGTGNIAVSFVPDPDAPVPDLGDPPPTILTVNGSVNIANGDITVASDKEDRGFFDVTGGSGTSTFNINKQDANGDGGTVINEKVTLSRFNVEDTSGSENFIVEKDLIVTGGNIVIGRDGQPAQVVLTEASLEGANGNTIDIDTTGKGSDNGVYSRETKTRTLEQSGSGAMTFENLHFGDTPDGQKPTVHIGRNVIVDPAGRHPDTSCVGRACPDQVTTEPEGSPF